jgi:preprotein translocase subunit SecD
MKTLTLNLALLILISGCGRKIENGVATNSSNGIPQFQIALGDVSSVSVKGVTSDGTSNSNAAATIYVEFTKTRASEFHDFTQEHLNQKIQILVGSNVVSEPVLSSVLPGNEITLHFSTLKEANTVLDCLKK